MSVYSSVINIAPAPIILHHYFYSVSDRICRSIYRGGENKWPESRVFETGRCLNMGRRQSDQNRPTLSPINADILYRLLLSVNHRQSLIVVDFPRQFQYPPVLTNRPWLFMNFIFGATPHISVSLVGERRSSVGGC